MHKLHKLWHTIKIPFGMQLHYNKMIIQTRSYSTSSSVFVSELWHYCGRRSTINQPILMVPPNLSTG